MHIWGWSTEERKYDPIIISDIKQTGTMKSTTISNYQRRPNRLHDYDYSLPGAYFITLVCWQRKCFFGEIKSGSMILNDIGKVIRSEWLKLADQFRYIKNDVFIIMPNHMHGIIIIEERSRVGATRPVVDEVMFRQGNELRAGSGSRGGSPLRDTAHPYGPVPGSLGAMIGQFKSRATKRIWCLPGMARQPVWQRNYHDHIIRNEKSLQDIYRYIIGNPAKWAEDEYFSG